MDSQLSKGHGKDISVLKSGWGARLDCVPHTLSLETLHVGGGVTLIY